MKQNTIKSISVEAKIYAIILKTTGDNLATHLHLGIHYTLEDAIQVAKLQFSKIMVIDNGINMDVTNNIDVFLWSVMDGSKALPLLLEMVHGSNVPITNSQSSPTKKENTSIVDDIKTIKDTKNKIMQDVIEKRDLSILNKVKKILSDDEITFVKDTLLAKSATNPKKNNKYE